MCALEEFVSECVRVCGRLVSGGRFAGNPLVSGKTGN